MEVGHSRDAAGSYFLGLGLSTVSSNPCPWISPQAQPYIPVRILLADQPRTYGRSDNLGPLPTTGLTLGFHICQLVLV